jgi:hypothetical protein
VKTSTPSLTEEKAVSSKISELLSKNERINELFNENLELKVKLGKLEG